MLGRLDETIGRMEHKLFRTVARKMLEQGRAEKELLVKHGLSDKLLDDLSAAIDEFDASVAETNGGKLDHVLAPGPAPAEPPIGEVKPAA